MEHVTIISKEAITTVLFWPAIVVGIIGIIFGILAMMFVIPDIKKGNEELSTNRPIKLLIHAVATIPALMITTLVCNIFFRVETGRYKYEGTLDPEMTIVEFEEFEHQYSNVRFEDGIWKWEDKE